MVILLPPISAFEFDNVKTIRDITFDGKTSDDIPLLSKYKPLEIQNLFGFGEVLWEGYIFEHTDECSGGCHSYINIRIDKDGSLVDDVKFKKLVGDSWEEVSISHKIYLETGTKEVAIPKYEMVCNKGVCVEHLIGTDYVNTPILEEYTKGEEVKAGIYKLRLVGDKNPLDTIDWVIKSQGEELEDWATWGAQEYVTSKHGVALGSTTAQTGKMGVIIQLALNTSPPYTYLTNVSKVPPDTSTKVYLRNSYAGADIATATFDANSVATFSPPIQITNGTQYFLLADDEGGSRTTKYGDVSAVGGYVFDNNSLNYIVGINQNGGNDTNNIFTFTNITYSLNSTIDFLTTLNSPVDNYQTSLNEVQFNGTGDGSGSITNMSLWHNASGVFIRNQTNTSIYAGTNISIFNATFGGNGFYLWNIQTCKIDGTCGFGEFNRTFEIVELTFDDVSYTTPVKSESLINITANISYHSSNWISISSLLTYNNTAYEGTEIEKGNLVYFNITTTAPKVTTSTNITFYWSARLTNTTGTYYYNSSLYGQDVTPLQSINTTALSCPTGFSPAFNFTSLIENNLSKKNFTIVNYNLQYGTSGNKSALTSYGNLSNIASFNLCINSSEDSYYVGYGEIQYRITGFDERRFYIFSNTRLTNTTVPNSLYSLLTSDATTFQITATNTALIPYENHYITLLRWYPNLNSYRVVDMGKTDENGQTVLKIKTEDVDYRLGLYNNNGVLVKLLSPIRMICQTTPCVYNLIVDLTETDLTTFLNVQSNLSFNPTTSVFTYIWNDPSQDTTLMNLSVWNDFPDRKSVIICSTSSASFTGVLVCDVSAYTGQFRAEVYREASPPILIAQLLRSIRDDFIDATGGKTMGLFIGLILIIAMALMGVVSPPLVIILSVIAVIPLIFLGAISFSLFIVIGAIAGILLHFLRRIQ